MESWENSYPTRRESPESVNEIMSRTFLHVGVEVLEKRTESVEEGNFLDDRTRREFSPPEGQQVQDSRGAGIPTVEDSSMLYDTSQVFELPEYKRHSITKSILIELSFNHVQFPFFAIKAL
ncbi:hypothetical protein KPH14_005468 [Odynerus spinipes]|uniref:Uncharacterized protein n=1 Tax=Odynerus spinipes TaxID=1348599 RepID=A0AAD9RCC1_9HYME|nr:hypothetical protein KPH14_005468 [Odynerus spinipes]